MISIGVQLQVATFAEVATALQVVTVTPSSLKATVPGVLTVALTGIVKL